MLSYVMVGADDISKAETFYSSFLPGLGYALMESQGSLLYSLPDTVDPHMGNGPGAFWVVPPFNGGAATAGNGTMIAFRAQTHEEVRRHHASGLASGGTDEGQPGHRAAYSKHFFVAYLRDPQGNKIALFCINPNEPGRDE